VSAEWVPSQEIPDAPQAVIKPDPVPERERAIREKYDRCAAGYDSMFCSPVNSAEDKIVGKILREALGQPVGKKVLDLGCGTGLTLGLIQPSYYMGLDISEGMLDVARQKYPYRLFIKESMENIEYIGSSQFDMVTCLYYTFSYTLMPMYVATEIRRVLKPGGRAVLMMAGPRVEKKILLHHTTYDPKIPMTFYNSRLIRRVFADFSKVEVLGLNYLANLLPFFDGVYLNFEFALLKKAKPEWAQHIIVVLEK
jgi:ubiquinone/menaquinone biosynthesis C-methylase UbiE